MMPSVMPVSNWAGGQFVLCGASSCFAVGKRRTGCRVCGGIRVAQGFMSLIVMQPWLQITPCSVKKVGGNSLHLWVNQLGGRGSMNSPRLDSCSRHLPHNKVLWFFESACVLAQKQLQYLPQQHCHGAGFGVHLEKNCHLSRSQE